MVQTSVPFHNFRSTQTLKYLFNITPSGNHIYNTNNQDQVETLLYNRYFILLDKKHF